MIFQPLAFLQYMHVCMYIYIYIYACLNDMYIYACMIVAFASCSVVLDICIYAYMYLCMYVHVCVFLCILLRR